ncbi:MAG: winged helix DNA-binding domain-containing protein [Planctomycetes bacterium]|nr:winged helix DNA-binding domain-containing protein [Planctomycetota bacterium]
MARRPRARARRGAVRRPRGPRGAGAGPRRAARAVPRGATAWPLRLLPQWDTQLMAHADKSWLAPDAAEHAAIWAKAGVVRATALARGRLVATWTHAKRGKALELEVTPLGGWRAAKHAKPVQREADALAAHLGLAEARVNCARA